MRKFIPIVIVVVGFLIWLAARRPSKPEGEALPMPKKVTENVTLPTARAKTIFQAPRARLPIPVGTSKECRSFLSALRAVDMSRLSAPMGAPENLPKGEGCAKLPDGLAAQDAAYREACLKPSTDARACLTALFFYRAAVTEWLTRNMRVGDIDDPGTLADKLFARFMTDPAGAADVAERLLELEPDFYPAAKAALLSRFMDAQKNAQGKPDDPRWKKTDELFSRAERNGREDSDQRFEMRIVTEIVKNPKPDYAAIARESEDYSRSHPESGVGLYHLAWTAFRQGDKPSAVAYLQQAYGRDGNRRYPDTAERIKKGEAEPFRTELSFSLDPNKYLR